MGYRSEIAFALRTVKPIEGLYAVLKIAEYDKEDTGQPFAGRKEVDGAFKDIVGRMRVYKSKNTIKFYADQWKWYGDCQAAFEYIIHLATNYDNDMACRFVRIGEQSDDTEEESYGEGWDLDYPCVIRRIEIDNGFTEEGDEDAEATK